MLDSWILALLGGMLTGVAFFGGLWYTILRGMKSSHPEVWFLVSLILRMTIGAADFVWMSGGRWDRLLACLAGFLLSRTIILRWMPVFSGNLHETRRGGASCA
jgi:F1F0 ATPase subunit 2